MFRKKKSLSDELFLLFSCKSAESGRFFIYLHDSNSIFWAQGIKSEGVSGGTVIARAAYSAKECASSAPRKGPYGFMSPAERRLRLQRRRDRSERNWNLVLAEASVFSRLTSCLSLRAQFHVVIFPGV